MSAARVTGFIAPGATLGVLGGGQLGRMFVHAAQRMGYFTAVLDEDTASPAGLVGHRHIKTGYTDPAGLGAMAEHCAAVTTEFENVPASSLRELAGALRVAPSADAVQVCQDRSAEKAHFVRCGVPCAPYAVVRTAVDLDSIADELLPGILKTARMGYDGKGQRRVQTRTELAAAWTALGSTESVLEKLLPLDLELSVLVARSPAGQAVHFPVQQNLHRDGILAVTQVPAPAAPQPVQQQAVAAAHRIASALDYVGVLCVEFFVLQDGSLVANEMAPRPHNSGHYTLDACDQSQFDLQVLTLVGAPLVAPRLHSPAVMLNLLGELWFSADGAQATPPWERILALPGAHLHLYGKREARPGRKMGHLTFTAPTADLARDAALQACALLGLDPF